MTIRKTASDYSRSHEPIVWGLFSAGGVIVAFFIPALILLTSLLVQVGIADEAVLSFDRVQSFAQAWWGKLFILAVIALSLYHTVHRIHHGLHDVHIHIPDSLAIIIFYGGATVLSCLVFVWLLAIGW